MDFNILNTGKYHSIFKIKEDEENYTLTDLFEIHFLEMKKLNGYSKEDDLTQWINFIKADSREILEEMAKVNSNIIKEMEERAEKKGKAEILIKQLVRKLSEVPIKYQDEINKLSEETLEKIALDIFDINSLSDLNKYFK